MTWSLGALKHTLWSPCLRLPHGSPGHVLPVDGENLVAGHQSVHTGAAASHKSDKLLNYCWTEHWPRSIGQLSITPRTQPGAGLDIIVPGKVRTSQWQVSRSLPRSRSRALGASPGWRLSALGSPPSPWLPISLDPRTLMSCWCGWKKKIRLITSRGNILYSLTLDTL